MISEQTAPQSPGNRDISVLNLINAVFYVCCVLTFAMVLIKPDEALKVFFFSSFISMFVVYRNFSRLYANKRLMILPVAILAFGLVQIIWVEIFKQPDTPFAGAYRSYQNGGKVLFFGSSILAAISGQEKLSQKAFRLINSLIILTGIGLYLWAGAELYTTGNMDLLNYRVLLGFEHQTGTAYALTLVALLVSQAVMNLSGKNAIPLYFLHFILSYSAITLTQTRAAMLVYPILCIFLFLFNYRHNRKTLFTALISFIILSLLALIPLKPVMEKRYDGFKSDMQAYSNANSETSVGSRLAMLQVAYITGKNALSGESLEQRNATIEALAKADPALSGAVVFMDVHLHNELMDTFSLKGIPGVVVLVILYLAMLYSALLRKSPLLLAISAAIVAYGLSDLLLYAKDEALICLSALTIALMMAHSTERASDNGR